MEHKKEVTRITIEVPRVSGDRAEQASEMVERLVEQYSLGTRDTNDLFNAMVAIYIRGRMVHGLHEPGGGELGAARRRDEVN